MPALSAIPRGFSMPRRMSLVSRFLAAASLFAALVALPACTNVDPGVLQGALHSHFGKNSEERKAALEALAKNENWIAQQVFNTALGDAIFYLPDSYPRDLTKNEDVFLNHIVGAYLARFPEVTYEMIDTYVAGLGIDNVLDKAGITRERFEYARGFGRVWLKSIEDDPKNKAMKERIALFQKRFGSRNPKYYTSIFSPHKIRALLRDDKAFEAFLKDDNAAAAWVDANQDSNKTVRDGTFRDFSIRELLAPVTIGVLPGLAS
ncbi:MAG: hypothetical protein IN818_07855 [Cutibacterium sp.]|nr:hypothetical protein [Cutibacterium sp.]